MSESLGVPVFGLGLWGCGLRRRSGIVTDRLTLPIKSGAKGTKTGRECGETCEIYLLFLHLNALLSHWPTAIKQAAPKWDGSQFTLSNCRVQAARRKVQGYQTRSCPSGQSSATLIVTSRVSPGDSIKVQADTPR